MKMNFRSLSHKLLLAFALLIAPILVLFYQSHNEVKNYLKDVIARDLRARATDKESDILFFIEMNKNRLQDFSTDGALIGYLGDILKGDKATRLRLSDYLTDNKLVLDKSIYLLNIYGTDGRIVASTDKKLIGSMPPFFVKGLRGLTATHLSAGLRGVPEVAISAPVYSRSSGKMIGVISGHIQFKEFDKLLTGESSRELGISSPDIRKLYRTAEVYLVGSGKTMLTSSRFVPNAPFNQRVPTRPVESCISGNGDVDGFYPDYRGVEVAGASVCLKDFGWTLLAEIDKDELFEPVVRMERHLYLTFAGVLGLISIFFAFVLKSTVGQLRTLSEATKKVTTGDYDIDLPVNTADEIGLLSASFNRMARGIKEKTLALSESEQLYRLIADNARDLIYSMLVPEGRYVYVSPSSVTLLGYAPEEFYGSPLLIQKIIHPDWHEYFKAEWAKLLSGDMPPFYEYQIIHKSGTVRWMNQRNTLIRDPLGAPMAIHGIVTDITDLKLSAQALEKSQASLSNAQRIAHIGNWDWDVAKNEIKWSDEIYRIFGITAQEFAATYEAFLSFTHPDDRNFVKTSVNEALNNKKPYSIDHRIVRPCGGVRYVHEQAEVLYGTDGRPVRMTGTVQDITERKKAEEEVKTLNAVLEQRVRERTAQLEASNRELEAFSYSVAHDLRAPLRIIDGFSHALLEDYGGKLDAQGHDHVRRVRESARRMGQLIDDLLDLSRVLRTELHVEQLDLSEMARGIARDIKRSDPERKVEFVIENGLVARGDARLIRLALDNLLANAWKFTGKNDTARIEFSSMKGSGGRKVYFVRDNGAGFDMKYVERLFIPFQRLHSMTEFSGTGIGLATVQRVVQRHGGMVWADARPGKGATFYFTL